MRTDNTPLFLSYWRAVDSGDVIQVHQAVEAILADFAPRIKALAWRFVYHDQQDTCMELEQDLSVAALEILPSIPHHFARPGAYLSHILKLRWRGLVRGMLDERDFAPRLLSIEKSLAEDFTLAEVLTAPDRRQQDDQASPDLITALQRLPEMQRIAVQRRYQFENVPFLAPPDGLSPRWEKDALMRAYRSLRAHLAIPAEKEARHEHAMA